jgi:Tfp pilus assembly protein PilV
MDATGPTGLDDDGRLVSGDDACDVEDGFVAQRLPATLQSLNHSADLLLGLSAYNLHQVQQQQLLQQQQQQQQQRQQQQQQQQQNTQFQLVPQQPQNFFPFTFTANHMAVTSNSGTASPPNSGSARPSYSDRERQIKRRTKTGTTNLDYVDLRLHDLSKATDKGSISWEVF